MSAAAKPDTSAGITINRCLGCGRSVLRTQTADGHVPGCPVDAYRAAYRAARRQGFPIHVARAEALAAEAAARSAS